MIKKFSAALFTLFILLGLAPAGFSFEPPGQCPLLPKELSESVQRTMTSKPGDLFVVLKNGLTVLIRQQPTNDVVSAQVFVRAGSIYEGRYLTAGLSHYLEHVLSGGSTRSFTETQAKERLQRMGGATNAYTTYDRTVYYINTSADHWKDALDLLVSYMSESTLDPREVAREKAVIQQEIKMGQNNPDKDLWQMFMKAAYRISPVRHPVIGYEEVFVHQDREALRNYYNERYQPENMVIAVAGNVNPHEVLAFITQKSKSFERRNNPPVVLPSEPAQTTPRWEEKEIPIARMTQAMIGFPSVSLHSKDLFALDVLALLLGEGRTCRLYCRLKDQESQVLSVGASNWTPSYVPGQFIISLTMTPDNWPSVLKNMEEEINRFKNDLVSPEELEKAKKTAIASHVFGKETAASQAASLASSYFDTGNPYFDETYVEEIRRVTPEQIREAARRSLDMDRMSVAVVYPPKAPEAATASAPPPLCEPAVKPAPVVSSRLDNGLKILLKRDTSLPQVTFQLYGLGGLYLEDSRKPGISAFTASLLTSGTKTRSKLDIARAIEEVGGGIQSTSDNNTYHVSIKVLKEDFDMAMDILSDVILNAQFPQEEIEKKRKDILLAFQRLDENWQAEIMRLFKKNYFKSSPYERDRIGTTESVQSVTREDLMAFYRAMVNPHHSVLTIYGDIDPQKVESAVREKLGTWEGKPPALPKYIEETRMIDTDRVVEKKNEKVSAALFIGANGLDIDSSKRPVMDVLDGVLSGASYPGGRLFEALRGGQENLVYVVSAFPFYGKQAGYYGVVTQTTQANVDKVQNIILGHLKRLSEELVPAEELEAAKDMLLTSRRMEMESLDAQAQGAAVNEVLGLGWDYDQRSAELIRAVKAEEVRALAKELFSHMLIARTLPENPVEILATPVQKSDAQTSF
jgi:zinc protease